MKEIEKYAIRTETKLGFEETKAEVTALLKKEGFGILTEIDMKATLKKKLGVDYKPYTILGACNPEFAWNSLTTDEQIGVFLPCNVVVWDDGDVRVVAILEPKIIWKIVGNPELLSISEEVSEKLHRIIQTLGK